jgi:catechol 2,3-dioxygenase-like lactoylglutathione lyase family enzyme
MPVPTRASHSSFSSTRVNGVDVPLRLELKAEVPAELNDVLAFYRAELGKRGWQEKPDGAVIAADRALLVFASPKGPGTLTLDRAKGETIVDLVQRNTEAAARANFLPVPGQARLIFGYRVPDVASLAINDQTIKIAGGVNHPQTLDLPPGTYPYELHVSGHLVHTDSITLAAGQAWFLRLSDDDGKSDQIY